VVDKGRHIDGRLSGYEVIVRFVDIGGIDEHHC
jgi:hypothetical protein